MSFWECLPADRAVVDLELDIDAQVDGGGLVDCSLESEIWLVSLVVLVALAGHSLLSGFVYWRSSSDWGIWMSVVNTV